MMRASRFRSRRWLVVAGLFVALAVGAAVLVFDRGALWYVVRVCAADAAMTGWPAPCLKVDPAGGYAVLPAGLARTHVIVTPLIPVVGIEDPALRRAATPNYVEIAWRERREIAAHAARPLAWDEMGLAINSRIGRSQDQLHIHVACVYPATRATLRRVGRSIPADRWVDVPAPLEGLPYRAIRLETPDLAHVNIIDLAARGLGIAPPDMFNLSLALLGAEFDDGTRGFYLLADVDKPGHDYPAHAEWLLDADCGP